MAEPFAGPIPPPPPIGRVQIVDDEGRATAVFAEWLAKLMYFLSAPGTLRFQENYDPPSLGPNASSPVQTMSVPGAKVGSECIPTFSETTAGLVLNAWVSAPDVVSFQFINPTTTTTDLPAGIVRVRVRAL